MGYDQTQVDGYIRQLSTGYFIMQDRLAEQLHQGGCSGTPQPEQAGCKEKRSFGRRLSDIVFYAAIALIVIATLIFSGKTNGSLQLFGYSGFTVLSGSMQREIPRGSLVITKEIDPNSIQVGDDITYLRNDSATVTHRVMDISENFEGSGERGFQTQGIENPEPDSEIVYEGNIIGVVQTSIPALGFALSYVAGNIGIVLLVLGGVSLISIIISKLFASTKKDESLGNTPQ
jgi:signal peptidase I